MIKRRFYKQDHGDGASVSSSSSSDDLDSVVHNGEVETEEDDVDGSVEKPSSPFSGPGYRSEDFSANEDSDSSGLLVRKGQDYFEEGCSSFEHSKPVFRRTNEVDNNEKASDVKNSIQAELPDCILRIKSVFKCRLCPRVVCLNEKSLMQHLNSKGHARSKKQLDEGRLKLMLNSDGEIEEEQETHMERHARILALAQEANASKKEEEPTLRRKKRKEEASLSKKKEETTQDLKNRKQGKNRQAKKKRSTIR